MRTTRAVIGALFFGVVILVALGSGAMSIGTYDGREAGAIGVEGSAILGSTVVLTGDGTNLDGPEGMAFDNSGNMWVANFSSDLAMDASVAKLRCRVRRSRSRESSRSRRSS